MPLNNISSKRQVRYGTRKTNSAFSPRKSKLRLRRKNLLRRKRAGLGSSAVKGAQSQLKRFRQGSILAIALTGFLLLFLTPGEAGDSETGQTQEDTTKASLREDLPDSVAIIEHLSVEDLLSTEDTTKSVLKEPEDIGKAAKSEALITVKRLWEGFYSNLPKILVALLVCFLARLFVLLIRFILRKTIGSWHNAAAITTLIAISVWLFAVGVAISVVVGDIRALAGSLGLVGLALSWSLQTPIESFTGWLLNSFRGYYKVGDRISVGDVFGDVYKIDFLTTTVWEVGAPYRDGFVQAEQPTGRMVTFPNSEVLSGTVVNHTGDFPYVWDELAIAIANESDTKLAIKVLKNVADELLKSYMTEPSRIYEKILKRAGLDYQISEEPQLFISIGDSWTDVIIRYLVNARERRKWKSELSLRIKEELNKPEYIGKIISVYPRQQVQFITSDGKPTDFDLAGKQ